MHVSVCLNVCMYVNAAMIQVISRRISRLISRSSRSSIYNSSTTRRLIRRLIRLESNNLDLKRGLCGLCGQWQLLLLLHGGHDGFHNKVWDVRHVVR